MPGGGDGDKVKTFWLVYFAIIGLCVFFTYSYWAWSASLNNQHIHATVHSATLSNLTVSNASGAAVVSYHLAVNLGLHDDLFVYYDDASYDYETAVDAELRFGGAMIGSAANDTKTNGGEVALVFDYGRGVAVSRDVAAELEKEMKSVGAVVSLELDLDVRERVTYQTKRMSTRLQKLRIWCWMNVPVKPHGRRGSHLIIPSRDWCRAKYR